jgi:hypothetical protein
VVGVGTEEAKMQMFLLVGATILGLGAAVGTATAVLSLVLRFMSKLR